MRSLYGRCTRRSSGQAVRRSREAARGAAQGRERTPAPPQQTPGNLAAFIEYGGGPLHQLEAETLVPCKRRPRRKPHLGLRARTGGDHRRLAGHRGAEEPIEPALMTDDRAVPGAPR